jgi:hypothetical protein
MWWVRDVNSTGSKDGNLDDDVFLADRDNFISDQQQCFDLSDIEERFSTLLSSATYF